MIGDCDAGETAGPPLALRLAPRRSTSPARRGPSCLPACDGAEGPGPGSLGPHPPDRSVRKPTPRAGCGGDRHSARRTTAQTRRIGATPPPWGGAPLHELVCDPPADPGSWRLLPRGWAGPTSQTNRLGPRFPSWRGAGPAPASADGSTAAATATAPTCSPTFCAGGDHRTGAPSLVGGGAPIRLRPPRRVEAMPGWACRPGKRGTTGALPVRRQSLLISSANGEHRRCRQFAAELRRDRR